MTAVPEVPAVADAPPAVVAEVPRRASRRLRAIHVVLHATVRKFFLVVIWLDRHRVMSPRKLLWLANCFDSMLLPVRPLRGTRLRPVKFAKFRAEWVCHPAVPHPELSDAAILYLHGGGLVACGLNSHRRLVSRIARVSGIPLLNVDYRQIAQAHVTETVEDCVEAYQHLLANGFAAKRIIVAGDSAGGGLAFSLALVARERGLPMPAAIVAIAPWANYDSAIKRTHPNDRTDAFLSADAYALPPKWGMAIDGWLDPAWSPVNHDFTGLPPALIQVASTEVLLADSEQLAQRCTDAGVPLKMQIWDNAFHVFQVAADVLPDARDAIDEIGRFVGGVLEHGRTTRLPAWLDKSSA